MISFLKASLVLIGLVTSRDHEVVLRSTLRIGLETPDGRVDFGLDPLFPRSLIFGTQKSREIKIRDKTLKLTGFNPTVAKGVFESSDSLLAQSKKPDGILGIDFFSEHIVILDFLNGTASLPDVEDKDLTFQRSFHIAVKRERIQLVLEDANRKKQQVRLIGQPMPAYLPFLTDQKSDQISSFGITGMPDSPKRDQVHTSFPEMIEKAPDLWGLNPYIMLSSKNIFGSPSFSWFDLDAPIVRIDLRRRKCECTNPTDSERLALFLRRFAPDLRWVPEITRDNKKTIDRSGFLIGQAADGSWFLVETVDGKLWQDLVQMASSRERFPELFQLMQRSGGKLNVQGRSITFPAGSQLPDEKKVVVGRVFTSATVDAR